MTAKEFLIREYDIKLKGEFESMSLSLESVQQDMINFAQYHVQEALKAASDKVTLTKSIGGKIEITSNLFKKNVCYGHGDYRDEEICADKDSILNAYPLTNIK